MVRVPRYRIHWIQLPWWWLLRSTTLCRAAERAAANLWSTKKNEGGRKKKVKDTIEVKKKCGEASCTHKHFQAFSTPFLTW